MTKDELRRLHERVAALNTKLGTGVMLTVSWWPSFTDVDVPMLLDGLATAADTAGASDRDLLARTLTLSSRLERTVKPLLAAGMIPDANVRGEMHETVFDVLKSLSELLDDPDFGDGPKEPLGFKP